MARFNAVKIRNLITNIFIAEGMKQADAEITANALIDANLCGRDSHGILRVLTYVDRIRKGGTNADSEPILINENQCSAVLDGNDAMGLVAAYKAAELCRRKALENGMAFVLVRNGGHYGAAGYWAEMIGKDDLFIDSS